MDPKIVEGCYNNQNIISYNSEADIYSLGTVFFEMLTGYKAFDNFLKPKEQFFKEVKEGNFHIPIGLSNESVSFLMGMLQYDTAKRLNADKLSKHHFLTKNVKDFKPINYTKLAHKIDAQGLKLNIILNQTIMAVVQPVQIDLINMPINYFVEKPIPEEEIFQITKNDNNLKNNYIPTNNINNNLNNNNAQNYNMNNLANICFNENIPKNMYNNKANNFNNQFFNGKNNINNKQYGNLVINANCNNMAKQYDNNVGLYANNNIYNKKSPQIVNQPVFPLMNPQINNNNMIYQEHRNNQLYQQYQDGNQIYLYRNYPQYQPINAFQEKKIWHIFKLIQKT
mgnify:FL=1